MGGRNGHLSWRFGRRLVLILLVLGAAQGLSAAAETPEPSPPRILAVLVGVSDYGDDPLGLGDLSGPRNDALLMADVLIERGADPADIAVLTTRPEDARHQSRHPVPITAAPTLSAIRAALDRLIDQARPGDQAVIHLAGHGWRQREAIRGSELSGLDEVFLPQGYGIIGETYDRARLDPLAGVLIDNEIGRYIDRLRGLGVDVVFVGDFCHAGDATRGRADFTRAGRPDPRMDVEARPSDGGRRIGSYAAFFAAPAGDRAMQGLAPIWADLSARAPHGLLSVYMAAALSDPTAATWADVAARVQASLIEHDVRDRAVRLDAPAQFEGDLDRPILGRGAAETPPWTVGKPALRVIDGRAGMGGLRLNAGALHGLTENSLVALSETRAGRERVVLYGRVSEVEPARARLTPADGPEASAGDWADIRTPEGRPYTDERLWSVRMVERGAPLTYRVAAVPSHPQRHPLDAILADVAGDIGVEAVATDQEAQLYLHEQDRVIILSESPDPHAADAVMGELDMSSFYRLRMAEGRAWRRQAIADAVLRAARAWRVRTLLAALDESATGAVAGLTAELYLWRPTDTRPGRCPPYHPGHRGLTDRPPADAAPFSALGLDQAQPPVLRPCDVIFARIVNTGQTSLDVTPLSLSPDGTIWALPWMDGRPAVRFEPGRARMTAVQLDPAQPVRIPREEMAVIAVLADPRGGAPAGFARLAQPGVGDTVALGPTETTRSGDVSTPLLALFEEARFGATRSASVPATPGEVAVRRFSWRVESGD
ncbi:caspase family protein [Brevundimonas sp. BAL450]|uniref:Peptidase C14 caspase domain-containing protein n=1 Tax=Brevundimonas abyssalis TAR-001 TaxID=1391729 RepID=A0A8E0NB41_9CAUL|nr:MULTISPECIES: caspase family protein [Brevundimonas]MBG7614822.1 caspase family protein [Brevundimonas sp. BAL450]GAD59206.1 hypothetical protein MBEBAB_1456 [Brevundimonas abyssalis TAR-001]